MLVNAFRKGLDQGKDGLEDIKEPFNNLKASFKESLSV